MDGHLSGGGAVVDGIHLPPPDLADCLRNAVAPGLIARRRGGHRGGHRGGFSRLEVGSDRAGSIRIPAAYCGVAGFKATENRIPGTGHIPHLPSPLGCAHSVRHMLSFGVLARLVCGNPVAALPTGIEAGLPVGVQIIGWRWLEDALLAVAAHLEPVLGGFVAPPPSG